MLIRFVVVGLFALCALVPGTAAASLILLQGHVSGEVENVLFHGAGLTSSGVTVSGVTADTAHLISFTENSIELTTPSSGQARVSGEDDAAFDWLTIASGDSSIFYRLEGNVKLSGPSKLRVTALGTSTTVFDFLGGSGENRFGVYGDTGDTNDQLFSVLIQSLDGDFISDLRQVRIGFNPTPSQFGNSPSYGPLVANPEPAALILFGTGLLGMAYLFRRQIGQARA
jgi:hypothetical protein